MTILTDLFVPLHALLFWLRSEVVDPRFIQNNKLLNRFLQCHVGMDTIWQTLCSYAEMHKISIAQKSHCACRVLSLATIRSKYYFNFILKRTRSGQELFDHPSYMALPYPTFINFKWYKMVWPELSLALLVQSPYLSSFPISTGFLSVTK